ncbi:LLM class F420-dependent oxidoreductase [Amycolatopsis rhizosphaerae]|uniref:LLM class F420-dependent oxidoreductase n=1 Tax=Amycolatopsis rhizosphaerae TaxID=2053003 RepID=A0A558DL88_9PSEU|nr:LLM class F420-dependent oxidoreductase [Amycolatopsis rhizosphaerae]TVT61774.1 LLM class F420-dependent oxidoreductase [Amycolatopsis rhizosphaerae]
MTNELGTLGVWAHESALDAKLARELESLGYGAIWIGGSPNGRLEAVDTLLDATERIVVATGIVNMWADDAATVARSYHRVVARHPGRFLLGVGIGHREHTQTYQKPYEKIVEYLDQLDEAGVPVEDRVLAALGPKVLKLAAERAAGAHPYLVTPEHTRMARDILGEGKLLAPEHKVVLSEDPEKARAIARPRVQNPYLGLANYVSNLRRIGWSEEDLADGGSDALVDALVLHGSGAVIADGIRAHLEAGADHVCVQALGPDPRAAYRAISEGLLS